MVLYKPNIYCLLTEHAVDPIKEGIPFRKKAHAIILILTIMENIPTTACQENGMMLLQNIQKTR